MSRKRIYVLVSVPALIGLAIVVFVIFQPIRVLPRLTLAPGYMLIDQDGERLTSEELRGKVVLYTIGYTGCGERCEASVDLMREVQDRLDEVLEPDDVEVKLVTISIDPKRDTPEVLRAAAAEIGADPEVWRLATAEHDALKALVGAGFRVYYQEDDEGGFRLDPNFFLVDGWGILRGEYRYRIPEIRRLLRDIGLVAKEARAATGVARLAYEAAHLFACYPTR